MNMNDLFPGKYLSAAEIDENGMTLTIESISLEEVGQDKVTKPVIYFEGEEKGMIINKTNFQLIVKAIGQGNTDHWAGHQITIYPTEVQFGKDMVEAIRVKSRPARTAPSTPASSPRTNSIIPQTAAAAPAATRTKTRAAATAQPRAATSSSAAPSGSGASDNDDDQSDDQSVDDSEAPF